MGAAHNGWHVNPMKTTTMVMLGLVAALVMGAGTVTAEDASGTRAGQCEPVWIDADNNVHIDIECIDIPPSPVLNNSP